jgi:hypothetical protein
MMFLTTPETYLTIYFTYKEFVSMKTTAYTAILGLLLISLATPWSAGARVDGPGASGTYKVVLEDGLAKQLEFSASGDYQGGATGQMTFRDEARVVDQDPDGEEPAKESAAEFYITADLDSLAIENNRALMGGVVRESSHGSYIGKWIQLVVADNGDDPDQFSWRFCQPEPGGWTPSDAEDPKDEGAWFRWWATDAELTDDKGVQSTNIIPGTKRGCATSPLSSYEFPEAKGEGQIQVKP